MPKGIQEGQTPEALRKKFGIVGGLSGMSIDEVIVPVVMVGDVASKQQPTEVRAVLAEDDQAAVAAQRSMVAIFNPADSGVILTLERVMLRLNPATSFVKIQFWDNPLLAPGPWNAAANAATFRDRRIGGLNLGPPYPAGYMAHISNAVLPAAGTLATIVCAANGTNAVPIPIDYTAIPGTGIVFGTGANNLGLAVTAWWTERRLQPDEA